VPRPEDVKDSNRSPATTMVTRMEICRGIVLRRQRRAGDGK
jgi:hypothetical protein